MQFSYDIYNNFKQPKLFLANPSYPQNKYIGTLTNVENLKITLNFHTMSEASFDIAEYVDEEYTSHYDKLEVKRLIEIQYLGWFQIVDIKKKLDDNGKETHKTVECLTLENELVGKRVDDINGVFALYNPSDVEHSLLHIYTYNTGWSIGHVDNELLSKWRTFDTDSAQVYNHLTTEIAKSFECIFTFDTYERKINAYKLSNIGDLTDIIISRKNILKEYIEESSADKIITKLRVVGGSDNLGGNLDIRAVNPTGTNFLINLDYFMTTEWVSQSLINAWNAYKTKYNNVMSLYNTTLTLLKSRQEELTTLKSQLVDLNSLMKAQKEIQGTFVQVGIPPVGSPEYQLYLNAVNAISSYQTQIRNKENEISAKEVQIISVRNSLDDIGDDLSLNSNFTQAQINEMNLFLTENEEYSDSTFVVTDIMSADKITEIQLELMQNAANELARASQPQYTIKISANNLYSIRDDGSPITYEELRDQCKIGNMLTIKYRDDYYTTARLISMTIDFNNPEDIDLTFSDRNRFDNELIQLSEILANSGRASSTISLNKLGWDSASKLTSPVREFMNGTFKATLNEMANNDNQEVLIDPWGLHGRKWLENQNKYSDYQMWLTNNQLLFSSDGFKTARAGIGLFTNESNETFYGVLADVICGVLFIGEKLKLRGSGAELDLSANNAITGLEAQFNVGLKGLSSQFTQTLADYSTISYTNDKVGAAETFAETKANEAKNAAETFASELVSPIQTRLTTAESRITQNALEIENRVSLTDYNGNTVVSLINQSATKISQSALDIDLTGYVTFNSLSQAGATTINGSNITTGTITAVNISGAYISGGSIYGSRLFSTSWDGHTFGVFQNEIEIDGGKLRAARTLYTINGQQITWASELTYDTFTTQNVITTNLRSTNIGTSINSVSLIYANEIKSSNNLIQINSLGTPYIFIGGTNSVSIQNGNISCVSINNSTPITSANLQQQFTQLGITVSYATSAGSATSANTATYATSAGYATNGNWANRSYGLSNTSSSSAMGYMSIHNNLIPNSGSMGIGSSANRWNNVYANNVYNSSGIITSSDERVKIDITPISDIYNILFDKLNPVTYKYKDGNSGRIHVGFIANDVEKIMNEIGLTTKEFAGLVKDPVYSERFDDGEFDTTSDIVDYNYFLRYEEFIPLIINKVKKLEDKIAEINTN